MPFFTFIYQKDLTNNTFLKYTPTLSLLFSSSSGLLGAIIISLMLGKNPSIRNFIHGPVAGAIIGGASSYFTGNIAYCMGIGLFGGSIQTIIQHFI